VTVAEAVCRGLSKCLAEALRTGLAAAGPEVTPVKLADIEDERCSYYWQALGTTQGSPTVGLGEAVFGFPVVWVGVGGHWYGSVGLNDTLALRSALQRALAGPDPAEGLATSAVERSSVQVAGRPAQTMHIPACEDSSLPEVLQSARQVVERNGQRIDIFDLTMEPFLRDPLAGVFGVLLREGEAR
jgi:hypothetical protein